MTSQKTKELEMGDQIFFSYLKIFCDKLFPGADFEFQSQDFHDPRGAYAFAYYPNKNDIHDENTGAIAIYIERNLLSFEVHEYIQGSWRTMINDSNTHNCEKLYQYNIFVAYQHLISVGAITRLNLRELPATVF